MSLRATGAEADTAGARVHLRLLEEDAYRSGAYHTGYLEELLGE